MYCQQRTDIVKCYESAKCSQKDRDACFVWNSFRDNSSDLENIKCWIMKGAYNEANKKQYEKCLQCPYYAAMNRDSGIVSDADADLAIISGDGSINNDRNKALEKTWQTLKGHSKSYVLLDLSRVNNIYSSGLGTIITIHKETLAMGGMLVVLCPDGYVKNLFQVTKLARILKLTSNLRDAHSAIAAHKQLLSKKAAEAPKPQEPKQQRLAPKERPPCHVYWKNKNPQNATTCDECFKKIKPPQQPCWVVDGMIEGISFQYINEDCEPCAYFEEFGKRNN
jgi:anti-sigma B factor antagonist